MGIGVGPCKRKTKEKEVRRVVELARVKYRGFNDRYLTEKLAAQEKLAISREKVRQTLRCVGVTHLERGEGTSIETGGRERQQRA